MTQQPERRALGSVSSDAILAKTQAAHVAAMQAQAEILARTQQQIALYEALAESQATVIGELRAKVAELIGEPLPPPSSAHTITPDSQGAGEAHVAG